MTNKPMGRQNGAAIRAIRKAKNMQLRQLADYVGLSCPQALTNIENGHRPAGRIVLLSIARGLDVPVEAITRDGTAEGILDDAPEPEQAPDAVPEAA